jgi:hypothetical protein
MNSENNEAWGMWNELEHAHLRRPPVEMKEDEEERICWMTARDFQRIEECAYQAGKNKGAAELAVMVWKHNRRARCLACLLTGGAFFLGAGLMWLAGR